MDKRKYKDIRCIYCSSIKIVRRDSHTRYCSMTCSNKHNPRGYQKGHKPSLEARKKISSANLGQKRPHCSGKNNFQWKGDAAGYSSKHKWLYRYMKKSGVCTDCFKETHTEWANVSHKYYRDVRDWKELCQSCHYYHDLENHKVGQIKRKQTFIKNGKWTDDVV